MKGRTMFHGKYVITHVKEFKKTNEMYREEKYIVI